MSRDVSRLYALRLSPPDLINYCLVNKETLENICNSREFWIQKLSIDYPEVLLPFLKYNLKLQNPKNTYIRKFTEMSKKLEEIANREEIPYDKLYKVYEELLKNRILVGEYSYEGYKEIYNKYNVGRLDELEMLVSNRIKQLEDAKEAMSLMK